MKEKFKRELKRFQKDQIFLCIQKAAENTFPVMVQAETAIPTKAGLLFWSLHLERQAHYVKHHLKDKKNANKMNLASTLVKTEIQKYPSGQNKQLVNLVKHIYSKMPFDLPMFYLPYSYYFFSNLLSEEYNSSVLPRMMVKSLPKVFPETMPSKSLSSWSDINNWSEDLRKAGYWLEEQNKKTSNDPITDRNAKRLYAAADIIVQSLIFLRGKKLPKEKSLDWNWCPLCWRPVKNSTGSEKCELHRNGGSEYQKVLRILKKMQLPDTKTPGRKTKDRIPTKIRDHYRHKMRLAFDCGFPKGWDLLPNTKNFLQKEYPEFANSDLDDCIEALSPGALTLFKKSNTELLNLVRVQIPENEKSPTEYLLRMDKESFITRAETWLSITSKIKRGGARKNAGRRAETKQERRKMIKKACAKLRAERLRRKNSQITIK